MSLSLVYPSRAGSFAPLLAHGSRRPRAQPRSRVQLPVRRWQLSHEGSLTFSSEIDENGEYRGIRWCKNPSAEVERLPQQLTKNGIYQAFSKITSFGLPAQRVRSVPFSSRRARRAFASTKRPNRIESPKESPKEARSGSRKKTAQGGAMTRVPPMLARPWSALVQHRGTTREETC